MREKEGKRPIRTCVRRDVCHASRGCVGEILDECDSTNDVARALGEAGAPHGSWVSCRRQLKGRGRSGRAWATAEGNLFLSFVARVPGRGLWTWVPLASALAVARAVEEAGGPALSVKWPNDLWLDGAKAGGLLCESGGGAGHGFVVIGIGLNCAAVPTGLEVPAASVGVAVDAVRPLVVAQLQGALARLEAAGPGPVSEEYAGRAVLTPGTEIAWSPGGGAPRRAGRVLGLGPSGELRVADPTGGREESLYAEDVHRIVGA